MDSEDPVDSIIREKACQQGISINKIILDTNCYVAYLAGDREVLLAVTEEKMSLCLLLSSVNCMPEQRFPSKYYVTKNINNIELAFR
jgi:hypothetical protein